jgi:hypothetical protein
MKIVISGRVSGIEFDKNCIKDLMVVHRECCSCQPV